ncbi:MAG: amidohydrolase family protein [Burkholderiaceae bacterium]|nr:amidohydrolase family protein [Burkholderiaceae bacterium]
MGIALCASALLSSWVPTRADTPAKAPMPIIDVHIHYSHDAWSQTPPAQAVEILRRAGLRHAVVSSSSDDGTQMLLREAPTLVVPSLRPYRRRGELSTWFHDPSVVEHLRERLRKNRYVAIGEFHVYGADADLPVLRRVVELAREYDLVLHVHGDADAVRRLFAQNPDARILWAHAGFDGPATVRKMLEAYPRLWTDLAFRSEPAVDGRVDPEWLAAFEAFPDRFMLGTDTFTPERWEYVVEHARWAREWLATLPRQLAEGIAWRNAERLYRLGQRRADCDATQGALVASAPEAGVTARLAPVDGAFRSGEPLALSIRLCPGDPAKAAAPQATPAQVRVVGLDATMPAHRHGMNTRPRLTSRADGSLVADGVLLHMAGTWEFQVRLESPGRRHTLRASVVIE